VQYGGEEKFTISLGNWLVERNQEVTLMGSTFASVKTKRLSKYGPHMEETIHKNLAKVQKRIRVIYPPYPVYLLSRLVMSALWTVKILSVNRKYPISLIHAQDTGYSGLAAVISAKLLGIPVLISSHGIRHKSLESIIQGRFRKALLNFEYRLDIFTIRNANSVIVVNTSIRDYYEHASAKKIQVIPIPIKLKNFQFSEVNRDLIRKELRIDSKTIVLGFIGRFSEEKNLFTFLNSFSNLAPEVSAKVVLVGTGLLEPELKEYVRKKGIEENVIFCGVRYDIARILSSFDIFVLPSYIEGLSTALLEAMTSGRAIICSNIGANQAVATHDQEALLAEAIKLLSSDPRLRTKLGYNAKFRASHYDEDIVFSKILQHYETLCRGKVFNISK
jgi:glycosyltransferase involved in cell wall biosynthesis